MRLFEKYFKLPFKLDDWGQYVWDADNNMVITFDEETVPFKAQEAIVSILNKEKEATGEQQFITDEEAIYMDEKYIGCLRSWGRLTGTVTLNLPSDKAAEIQDDLGSYIVERLNKKS